MQRWICGAIIKIHHSGTHRFENFEGNRGYGDVCREFGNVINRIKIAMLARTIEADVLHQGLMRMQTQSTLQIDRSIPINRPSAELATDIVF